MIYGSYNENFDANEDSIGEWGGHEKTAIDTWNTVISPILNDARDHINISADDYFAQQDWIQDVAQFAWEKFCDDADVDGTLPAQQQFIHWLRNQLT